MSVARIESGRIEMDPMVWPLLLLLIGLALIVLEVFIPSGGILGVLAAAAVTASIVTAFRSGVGRGLFVLALAAALAPLGVFLAIRVLPHTPMGRRLLLQQPESEEEVLPDSEPYRLRNEMVGKRGLAKTKLLPSGAVVIEGRTYEAISEGMPIESGEAIEVAAVRTNRLVVRPAPQAPSPPGDDLLSRPIDALGLDAFEDPLA